MKTLNKVKKNKGFALLFSVMLSTIILAVALGVASVSFKEIQFGTDAKATNNSFYAADTAGECALLNDKSSSNIFTEFSGATTLDCNNISVTLTGAYPVWSFDLSHLGSDQKGCAKVVVDKTSPQTHINVKGYNTGSTDPNTCTVGAKSIERRLDFYY